MTIAEILALVLMVPSAFLSFRKAPTVSLALLIAFTANLAYANGIAAEEWIRWVSALVGAAGAFEFGRGAERLRANRVSIPGILKAVDGGTWIGLAAFASMAVDGFGMFVFRLFDVWIVPEVTIGILVLIGLIGVFWKKQPG